MFPYYVTIAAGAQEKRDIRGNFLGIIEASAAVNVQLVGSEGHSDKHLYMQSGDSIEDSEKAPIDFNQVLLTNNNAAAITVRFQAGYGKFTHRVSSIANVAPVPTIYTPGEMQLLNVSTQVNVSGTLYYNRIVVPENPLRKALHVRTYDGGAAAGSPMHSNQTLNFGYCLFDTATGQPHNDPLPSGFPLAMGEGRTVENSGEIGLYVTYPITGSQVMSVFVDEEF